MRNYTFSAGIHRIKRLPNGAPVLFSWFGFDVDNDIAVLELPFVTVEIVRTDKESMKRAKAVARVNATLAKLQKQIAKLETRLAETQAATADDKGGR